MIVSFDDNYIYFKAKSRLANQLGAFYTAGKKAYKIPISMYSIERLHEEGFDLTPIQEVISKLKERLDHVHKIKSKEDTTGIGLLRPYQRVDVEFINHNGNVAIFNEQRTGKTPTILTAIKDKLGKGIIVCPSGLKLNWAMEYDKWVGKSQAKVVKGTPKKRLEIYNTFTEGVLVMSYETLRQDIEKVLETVKSIDVLVIDEAHRLRNYTSKQSIALFNLSRVSKNVYPMTGTPAVNHPSDVFGILKLVNPKRFRSYWQFVERYFGYVEGRFGRELLDFRHEFKEEFQELLETYSVQRKRRDVMSWIPKVTTREIFLDIDNRQKKHYNQILNEFRYGDKDIPNVIAQLTRLRQVCTDPSLLMLDGGSPKTDFILEYLSDNDGKVIIFSAFSSYLRKLKEVIPDAMLLTGDQTQAEKQDAVDQFQYGDVKVLLANIIAGGTGWTLDNADTIIFTDKSYNPVDNEQAADRFIPTQKDKEYGAKQIINLKIKDTVEIGIQQLLEQKVNIIQYVNDYGMKALVELDKGENNNNASVSNKR